MRPAVATLTLLLAASAARAGEAGPSIYEVRWDRDLALLAGATAVWVGPSLVLSDLVEPSCPCGSAGLPAIDRVALGRSSRAAAVASDVSVLAVALGPLAVDAAIVGASGPGVRALAEDALVVAQAVAFAKAATTVTKYAVQRPRPLLRDAPAGDPELAQEENYLSFFSGHGAIAFSAGMAWATTLSLRGRGGALAYAAAAVAGTGVGTLRILAGKHFPTDVAAGALVGTASGLLLPRLYRRGAIAALLPLPDGAGVALTARF